jgi:ATP adenylyltransferase
VDFLWSPWRYGYVTQEQPLTGCIFCLMRDSSDDDAALVLHRARHSFVVLNRFPYTSGHLMLVPNQHVATLSDCPPEALQEMSLLARQAEANLVKTYNCPGLNLGFNIGACAGAGVAGHIHMHVLPRWPGDVNFMTTIGETRVLPEDLAVTYRRLKGLWI